MATPQIPYTVDQVLSFPKMDSFTAATETDSEIFYPNYNLFVVPPNFRRDDEDREDITPDQYLKIKLQSIHRNPDVEESDFTIHDLYLFGTWIYAPSEFKSPPASGMAIRKKDKALLKYFGDAELIVTNQVAIIEASAVESRLYLHPYDDRERTKSMKDGAWYTRTNVYWGAADDKFKRGELQGLNLAVCCQKPYGPTLHEQRYCTACKEWYHVDCLTPFDEDAMEIDGEHQPDQGKDLRANILAHPIENASQDDLRLALTFPMSQLPTLRGVPPVDEEDDAICLGYWNLTGSGAKIDSWKGWLGEGNTMPDDLVDELGEVFVNYVLLYHDRITYYECKQCDARL